MIKLRPRKTKDEDQSLLPKTPALTSAEKSKRYRSKLKEDPIAWEMFKEKERKRKKNERKNLTEEQKNMTRLGNRVRQARYRSKIKQKDDSSKPKTCKTVTKMLTRKEREKKRKYWRERQRVCRSNQSTQKKRRKREKDNRYRAHITAIKLGKYMKRKKYEKQMTQIASTLEDSSNPALRKSAYRLKKRMPKNPMKFAELIDRLVNTASPRKREALQNKGIQNSSSRAEKEMLLNVIDSFNQKMKQGQISKAKIASACNIMKKYRFAKATSTLFGISPSYTSRAENYENETRKKRKDATSDDIRNKVHEYFKEPTVSTAIPDRKSVKKGEERKTIDRPVKDIYQEFIEEHPDVNISYSTFSTLRPQNVETTKKTPWYSCLCETCTNVDLKIKTLNLFSARNRLTRFNSKIKDKYEAINLTMCPKGENAKYYKKECIERKCTSCNVDMLVNHFQDLLQLHGGETIEFSKWENIKTKNKHGKEVNKIMLVREKILLNDLVIELSKEVSELSYHLFVARWQQQAFSTLVKDLPVNWVVLNLDFAENYSCVNQNEIQSAYWGHNQVTIHPIVTYYKCPKEGCEINTQEVLIFVSDDLTHDSHAVAAFLMTANQHLRERGLTIEQEIIFSDGCAGQYKSITPFMDVSYAELDFGFPIEKHFYGSRHGKGPSDGAGAVIKNAARRAVKGEDIVINNAKDLFEFAKRKLTRDDDQNKCVHSKRTIFLTTSSEINRNRPERVGKTVKGTRSLHAVKTVNPRIIKTRKLSCFCVSCKNQEQGDCSNNQYVDQWESVQLYRRGERQARAKQVNGRGRGRGLRKEPIRQRGRGRRGNGGGRGQENGNEALRGRNRGRGRYGRRQHQHRNESSDTDISEDIVENDITMDFSETESTAHSPEMEVSDEEDNDEHDEESNDVGIVTEDVHVEGDTSFGSLNSILTLQVPLFDMSDEIDAPYAIDLTSVFEALDTGIDISQIDYIDGNDDTHVRKAGYNTVVDNTSDSMSMDNNGDNVLMNNTGDNTQIDKLDDNSLIVKADDKLQPSEEPNNTGENTQKDNTGNNTQKGTPGDNILMDNNGDNTQDNPGDKTQKGTPGDNILMDNTGDNTQKDIPGDNTQNGTPGDNTQKDNTGDNQQKDNTGDNTQIDKLDDNSLIVKDDDKLQPSAEPDNTDDNTQKDNTGNNVGDNTQDTTGDNTQDNTGDNTQKDNTGNNNIGDNTQDTTGDNTQDNTGDNIGDNTQDTTGDNTQDNTADNTQKDITGDNTQIDKLDDNSLNKLQPSEEPDNLLDADMEQPTKQGSACSDEKSLESKSHFYGCSFSKLKMGYGHRRISNIQYSVLKFAKKYGLQTWLKFAPDIIINLTFNNNVQHYLCSYPINEIRCDTIFSWFC